MMPADDEERILKIFAQANSTDLPNKRLLNASGLDEEHFLEVLRTLERREFIERYVGHTLLLAKGRVYVRKVGRQ